MPAKVICTNCEREFLTNPAYLKRRMRHNRYCSKECMLAFKRGNVIPYIDSQGYYGTSYGRVHRIKMEQKLGRKLKRTEHVHHINGNKRDNRIENLEVLSDSDHHRLHPKTKTGVTKRCPRCNSEFYRPPSLSHAIYCNMDCYNDAKVGKWTKKATKDTYDHLGGERKRTEFTS